MSKKKNIHLTGALGAVLNAGGIETLERKLSSNKNNQSLEKATTLTDKTQNRSTDNSSKLIAIDPKNIIRWEHKDRPENELGDIKQLAQTFREVGQQQPCIVRPYLNDSNKYELIVGERRWKAAQSIGVPLKVLVKNINNKTAALIQAVENEEREGLSDYAKGMSYADKIEKEIFSQKDLVDMLGISKQQVSRLLSFRKIPSRLKDAIGDMRNISARTSEEMVRLCNKDEKYLDVLIEMAGTIQEGKLGSTKLLNEVKKRFERRPNNFIKSNQKVMDKDGRHLFTLRLDNNATPSIHFPKDIVKLFYSESICLEEVKSEIKNCLAKKLTGLKD